jgi:hypothetical protein
VNRTGECFGFWVAVFWFAGSIFVFAQDQSPVETRLDNGLHRSESQHLTLITDLPMDDAVRDLPRCFELALPQWGKYFEIDSSRWDQSRATVYLMRDRELFVRLGILPVENSNFRHGYQVADELYVMEQPSEYYRRHLLLHEATHWFIWKFLGGSGPPWLSEGLSEVFATHRWDGKALTSSFVPLVPEEVPYWGRITMIREARQSNQGLRLNEVLSFSDNAHRTDAPYAWSWACVKFLSAHSRTQTDFRQLARSPINRNFEPTFEIRKRHSSSWKTLEQEWQTVIEELDYGFDFERSTPNLLAVKQKPLKQKATMKLSADRGWQSTGILLSSGQSFSIQASGRVIIRQADPSAGEPDWYTEAHGITLRYHLKYPIGIVLGRILPDSSTAGESESLKADDFVVGDVVTRKAGVDGLLLLKINEASSELFDNRGAIDISISPEN